MFGILVARKLEESYMAAKFRECVIRLGISEPELEFRDFWEAPDITAFGGKLGGYPKLENLGLAFKFAAILAVVDGCETRDVYLATVVVLTDALGEKVAGLRDLKNLVGRLEFGPLFVSQATPRIYMRLRGWGEVDRLKHLLSLLNINGHAKETARRDIVWRLPAITKLRSFLSGKHALQFTQGNIYPQS